jgi:type VI secretion system secreted protein VgrG
MAYLEATLLSGDLPEDAKVVALSHDDAISRPFTCTIDFTTTDPDLDLVGLLGKPVAVRVDGSPDDPPLVVHGQVEEAEYVDARAHTHHYRIALAPLLQGLAHRVRSRIFQDKNAVDVVKAVLKGAGLPDAAVAWHVAAQRYPKRVFCVQYRESELAFVMRLLEEEGIFFWFQHTETEHVMHIADDATALPSLDGDPVLAAASELHAATETVTDLVLVRRVVPDAYATRDWYFERPDRPAEASAEIAKNPALEVYEYPGGFQDPGDGSRVARVRADELAAPARVLRGDSNALRLGAGRTLEIEGAPVAQMNGKYALLAVQAQFRAPFFASEGDEASFFRSSFEAVPAGVVLRPPRRTPKPRIWGLESAVVTGPPGEEIHVDELGRIKVHFYWDREGKIDEHASCWIRVQQQNTRGSMLLPRVGWEMSVGFVDGDPDRPVVLQKLYNRETMPPYGMPANKTQSALQSSTSPGGGATNEIRLQDGSGGMEFFIHSSKNLTLTAGKDVSEDIAVDAHQEVGLALSTKVGADETVQVGSGQSVNVTGNYTDDTVGNKTVTVGAVDDWGVTGNFAITTNGNRSETIGAMMNVMSNQVVETYNANYQRSVGAALALTTASALVEAVGGSKTESVGGAKMEIIRLAKAEQITGPKTLTSGLVMETTGKDIGVAASAAMTVTVGGPIVEKVGDAFTLSAKAVLVTAVGGAEMKAGGSSLKAKGATLSVKAPSLGASGGPQLKLKGRINYKD